MAGVRPSVSGAVRAALATGVPLLAAHALGEPGLVWMAIGGFIGALVDRGGSYGERARNLAAVSLGSAVAGAVAALAGHSAVLAVPGMLIWASAASFLRVYGVAGANTGLTSSVTFAVSLAMPLLPAAALARGGWLLAGGAWAALLALAFWPLRPLLPARSAVGRCYRALAAYAREIAEWAEREPGEHGVAGRGFDGVRQALEEARGTLGSGWDGRGERGAAAEQLLVLLETAEQMLGSLVALSDVAERLPGGPCRPAVAGALREVGGYVDALAGGIGGRGAPPVPRLGARESCAASQPEERAALTHADDLLRTLREFADGARETLEGGRPASGTEPARDERGRGAWLDPLRDNLSADSVLLRHALRVGVTAALAVAISRGFRLEHGHWVTLTVIFILQPYAGLTLVKGLQRVVGTVVGGIVAALLPLALHHPVAPPVVISLLAAAAVVTFPLNYAIFAFFVTPTFVLLAEMHTGSWDLAGARVVHTLIGAALAMAGARLLWSLPERRRFPAYATEALRAARDYLRAAAEARAQPALANRLPELRRELGLAIINAGESFQRLVIEEGAGARAPEAEHTLLVYLRRLAAAAVALATAPPLSPPEAAALRDLVAGAEDTLESLARALAEGRSPPPLPPPADPAACPSRLRLEVERIDRPIRVLHSVIARAAR